MSKPPPQSHPQAVDSIVELPFAETIEEIRAESYHVEHPFKIGPFPESDACPSIENIQWPEPPKPSTNPKDRIGITKVPLSLLPPAPQAHTSLALLDGLLKYGRWNWRSESVAASVYLDACCRHLQDWIDREEVAGDSHVHHLGHAAACLFIIMDAQECGNLVDDRPDKSCGASELFTKLIETVEHLYAQHEQKVPFTSTVGGGSA